MTALRGKKLEAIVNEFFNGSSAEWESFCKSIANTPFLMGEGDRGWHISIDWILIRTNLQKVLDENYKGFKVQTKEDGLCLTEDQQKELEGKRREEVVEKIESIKNPVWKEVCQSLLKIIKAPDLFILPTITEYEIGIPDEEDKFITIKANRYYRRYDDHIISSLQKFYPQITRIVPTANMISP